MYIRGSLSKYEQIIGTILAVGATLFMDVHFITRMIEEQNWLWIILIIMMTFPMIAAAVQFAISKSYKRCFLKCDIDQRKIRCYGFLWKPWEIRWEDVCAYKVDGYDYVKNTAYKKYNIYALYFLIVSTDPQETFRTEDRMKLTSRKALIPLRPETHEKIISCLPSDMYWKVKPAIDNRSDYVGYRKKSKKS